MSRGKRIGHGAERIAKIVRMTPDESSTNAEPESSSDEIPSSRKRSLLFLIQFLILVSILLIGYRYAINSAPNIRYLFSIASQTSAVLGVFGHSSELEPYRGQYPAERIRAELTEWKVTSDRAASRENGDAPPLTSWEFWLHSAQQVIRNGPGLLDHGPTIRFVARQGLATRRLEFVQELDLLRKIDAPAPEIEAVQSDIKSLDDEITALFTDPKADRKKSDREFSFRIVPDCGAIPSMAIYLSAVLAFPVRWRKRIIGVVGGLATLYAINIARLVVLAFVGAYDPTPEQKWFTFIHEYVWQSIFLLFVVSVWLAWIELIVKPRQTKAA